MNQFRTSLRISTVSLTFSSLFGMKRYFVCFSWRFEKAAEKFNSLKIFQQFWFMINYNKMSQLVCEIWKCSACSKLQTLLLNTSNLDIIWFIVETSELFFSLTFNKFFLFNIFWLKTFVSLFCSSGLLHFFIRVTS